MNIPSNEEIKLQEWLVRFDGKIKQSEELINSKDYHKHINEDLEKSL